jgi:hypothetical protein
VGCSVSADLGDLRCEVALVGEVGIVGGVVSAVVPAMSGLDVLLHGCIALGLAELMASTCVGRRTAGAVRMLLSAGPLAVICHANLLS